MTLREALAEAARELELAGCPSPRVDAEFLLAHALGRSRTELYVRLDEELPAASAGRFQELAARRARREPLAYVLGEWGFRRLTLRVDDRVLVPRPETEAVVERCLRLLADAGEPEVLDVGVGCGAIALSLADEHPTARVTAFDSSKGALAVARENLRAIGLDGRVEIVEHDLRSGFGVNRFDLVVSNPPYVREDEVDSLEPEVRDWEPREALVSSEATEAVARGAYEALRDGGWLVLEVADGQAGEVGSGLAQLGYSDITIDHDLAGRERIVSAKKG